MKYWLFYHFRLRQDHILSLKMNGESLKNEAFLLFFNQAAVFDVSDCVMNYVLVGIGCLDQ